MNSSINPDSLGVTSENAEALVGRGYHSTNNLPLGSLSLARDFARGLVSRQGNVLDIQVIHYPSTGFDVYVQFGGAKSLAV
ncbi:MAG: hypothetical protein WC796_00535 [Candidatus Pacearchaeota archaeon]